MTAFTDAGIFGPGLTPHATGTRRRWSALASVRRNPRLYAGALILVLIAAGAIGAPLLTPFGPTDQELINRLRPPGWDARGSWTHVLGTDTFGRDVFSRLLYGARYSLLVAGGAVIGSGVIGVVLGAIAGYVGRRPEAIIMRAVDAQQSLSTILLALMVADRHHHPSRIPEHGVYDHRHLDAPSGTHAASRGGAKLSRPRRAGTLTRVGDDPRGRLSEHLHRVLPDDDPGSRHNHHRLRREPTGRWVAPSS